MNLKKAKILIPSLSILALGIGAASCGTLAWFEATRNIVAGDSDKPLDVKSSGADIGDIKIYLVPETDASKTTSNPIVLTDNSGNTWAVVKNTSGGTDTYIYQSVPTTKALGTTYGQVTFFAVAYKGDTTEQASYTDLIPFVGYSVSFKVSGEGANGTRTRVSNSASTVYSATAGTSYVMVTVTITSATSSGITYSYINNPIYYSVTGGSTTPVSGEVCPDDEVDRGTGVGLGHIYVKGENTPA